MGFFEDNKNFIQIKLFSEMRGLSKEERSIKYEVIKDDARRRLKRSYVTSSKTEFYTEAFDVLFEFEPELLLLNIFFEDKSYFLINDILKHISTDQMTFKSILVDRLYKFISPIIKKKEYIEKDDINTFIKKEFIELIEISEYEWEKENHNRNDLVRSYSNWIINNSNSVKNIDIVVYSILLYTKIYNFYPAFLKQFNTKSIIFLNSMIDELENFLGSNEKIFLYETIERVSYILDGLFNKEIIHTPLTDKETLNYYSNGYLLKRAEFSSIMENIYLLQKDYSKSSFAELFEILKKSDSKNLDRIIYKEVRNRIDNGNLPKFSDIIELELILFDKNKNDISYDQEDLTKDILSYILTNYFYKGPYDEILNYISEMSDVKIINSFESLRSRLLLRSYDPIPSLETAVGLKINDGIAPSKHESQKIIDILGNKGCHKNIKISQLLLRILYSSDENIKNLPFKEIFRYLGIVDDKLEEFIKNIIFNKIDLGDMPTENDLKLLMENDFDKILIAIYEKTYQFQYLNL